jgi:hypothetical protein
MAAGSLPRRIGGVRYPNRVAAKKSPAGEIGSDVNPNLTVSVCRRVTSQKRGSQRERTGRGVEIDDHPVMAV